MLKGLLALAVCLAACSHDASRRERPSDWRTLTAARQISGEPSLRAEIQYGAGTMEVTPAAAGTMYHAVLRYDNNQYTPSVHYADGVLRVGIDGEMHGSRHIHTRANRLDLQLGPGVPLDLDVQYGAGEGTLELGGLNVHSATIQTGASKTYLRFSTPTQGTCDELHISVGAAKMEVTGLGNLSPRKLTVEGGAVGLVVFAVPVGMLLLSLWRRRAALLSDPTTTALFIAACGALPIWLALSSLEDRSVWMMLSRMSSISVCRPVSSLAQCLLFGC